MLYFLWNSDKYRMLIECCYWCYCYLFVNDTATTYIDTYRHTLSLRDALPIWPSNPDQITRGLRGGRSPAAAIGSAPGETRSSGFDPSASFSRAAAGSARNLKSRRVKSCISRSLTRRETSPFSCP